MGSEYFVREAMGLRVVLVDAATAAALAQILPVLLISLLIELRRTELHHRGRSRSRTRFVLAAFFATFGIIETTLVLSIDGKLIPFEWSDLAAALIIFALLAMLFVLAMVPTMRHGSGDG
jgi:hypothetical protein